MQVLDPARCREVDARLSGLEATREAGGIGEDIQTKFQDQAALKEVKNLAFAEGCKSG